jgi:hypothetical protein
MPTQSIDSQILQYLPLLERDEKKSVLTVIKSFLKHKEEPSKRLTIEQYNKELEEAEARFEAGEFFTMEEVEEMAKKW